MAHIKTIVCFANSRKKSGRCIAGKEQDTSKLWIRPISERETHEISEEERRYKNGQQPDLLDIIQISFHSHQPTPYQYENHVIDSSIYWEKVGTVAWRDVCTWLDSPNSLWKTGESSYSGTNNRIEIKDANGFSLYLISVVRLQLLIGKKSEYSDSKRAVRGQFRYQNTNYLMDVTDPKIEQQYLGMTDGEYVIPNPVLCVSLSDPYQANESTPSYCYKLIAAVLYQERFP